MTTQASLTSLALTRLLQMASQAFPIGGYSHSQGLEAAIEAGLVRDEDAVRRWILDLLEFSMGSFEIPCLLDLGAAWAVHDLAAVLSGNEEFLATRESAEFRKGSVQMGYSMRALLAVLPGLPAALTRALEALAEPSLPCVWSGAAWAWQVPEVDSAIAYLWAWAENQVLVALKSVPLGQSAGQRILLAIGGEIAGLAQCLAATRGDRTSAPRSNFAPGLAILSSHHETQYSRLFRS